MGFAATRNQHRRDGRLAETTVPPETACDLAKLGELHPASTPAERLRFLNARDGKIDEASEQLRSYLVWRTEHGLDDSYDCGCSSSASKSKQQQQFQIKDPTVLLGSRNSSGRSNHDENENEIWHACASDQEGLDELDWRFASQAALLYEQQERTTTTTTTTTAETPLPELPQLARIVGGSDRDKTGHKILQLLPARMDLSVASDLAFALSIALYLEAKLDRTSPEKLTVAIDVRGGRGWANPKPRRLLPFVKKVAHLLERLFPERLERCLVYPVPAAAHLLWKIVKAFLDPDTARKIDLVPGDSSIEAAPPYGAMNAHHIDGPVLRRMEDVRCGSFGRSE